MNSILTIVSGLLIGYLGMWVWEQRKRIKELERTIAKIPDGYSAASAAYAFLISMPVGARRVKAQGLMCQLRDYLADASGKSGEEIQVEYEQSAIRQAIKKVTQLPSGSGQGSE